MGPRLNFSTAWSTNAICIFHACGLTNIPRAECSRRYLVHSTEPLTKEEKTAFTSRWRGRVSEPDSVHDHMTEEPYLTRLCSFQDGSGARPDQDVPCAGSRQGGAEGGECAVRV